MKLRNKLVAVMATSMVVTSVPVVTMADSSNTINVYNYNIKDTTIGFGSRSISAPTTASDYSNPLNYVTDSKYVDNGRNVTTTDALHAKTIGASSLYTTYTYSYTAQGNNFSITNLPGIEIAPKHEYLLGGNAGAVQQTAYATLTKDSNYVEDAYLYFMDAMYGNGDTSMLIDDNGRIWNSNHGPKTTAAGWDGLTRDEVTQKLKTVNEVGTGDAKSNGAPITVYYDAVTGEILTGAKRASAITNAKTGTYTFVDPKDSTKTITNPVAGVNITIMDWTETEINDRKYKSSMRMDFFGDFEQNVNRGSYKIPFLVKVGGDDQVLVNLDGKDSFVTSMTYTLTDKLTNKKLIATADSKTITKDNTEEIGEIRLDETAVKSLINAGNRWIKIQLPSSADLEFDLTKTKENLKATGKRGFYNVATGEKDNTTNDATLKANASDKDDFQVVLGKEARSSRSSYYNTSYTTYTEYVYKNGSDKVTTTVYQGPTYPYNGKTYTYDGTQTNRTSNSGYYNDDVQTLLIKLPDWADNTSKGQLVLTGIYVRPQEKEAALGDVNITLSEDLTHGNAYVNDSQKSTDLVESTTLKVATITDYGVVVECENPPKVKAGRSGVVSNTKTTFIVKEAVKDSLVDSRRIELNLENGYIFGPADVYGTVNNATGYYNSTTYKQAAKDRFLELVKNETIKFEEKAGKDGAQIGFDLQDVVVDANGYVTGFTAYYPRLKSTEDDKIKVTMPVATSVMSKGDVKLKVGNVFTRAHEKDVEGVVANIVEPISVEIEKASVKVGLEGQTEGSITIKETDKGMLERGWLFLSAENLQDGITFTKVPTVKVGDEAKGVKIENVTISKDKKAIAMEITRTSTEASTISISDIQFTTDRTVPEANYDLDIWGTALTDEDILDVYDYSQSVLNASGFRGQYTDKYTVADFIQMTTKNTQDLNASGLKAATAAFVIGENKFTVNGETVTMDSAAYIKDNYTMVPVKYVAKAFGIEGNAVQYDQKTSTATIVAGNKVIAITAGKAVITVNGTAIPMATKAEVKDGRMCVPMAYIASALDVQKNWDATTKTATFTNQTEETK